MSAAFRWMLSVAIFEGSKGRLGNAWLSSPKMNAIGASRASSSPLTKPSSASQTGDARNESSPLWNTPKTSPAPVSAPLSSSPGEPKTSLFPLIETEEPKRSPAWPSSAVIF